MDAQELKICEESPAEQEERKQASRMKLKDVQNLNDQKENFTFKVPFAVAMSKDAILAGKKMEPENKRHKPHKVSRNTQTHSQDELDLIGEDPSTIYWKKVAGMRREALRTVITENEKLRVEIALLSEKLQKAKETIRDLDSFNEVLAEIVAEGTELEAGRCSYKHETPPEDIDSD